jgi:hypothetical protein
MKPTNSQYDFNGLSCRRVLANFIRWKALPFGYLGKGPGIIFLVNIILRHHFGRLIATIQIKYSKQISAIKGLVKKIKPN